MRAAAALVFTALLTSGVQAGARERLLEQALGADALIEAVDLFLEPEEEAALARRLGEPLDGSLQTIYVARKAGKLDAYAILGTRRVRTHTTTAIVVVAPDGHLSKTVVGAFHEPPEYLPVARWFRRLRGRGPRSRLVAGDDIPAVSGATLSARCFTALGRRALALVDVYRSRPPGT